MDHTTNLRRASSSRRANTEKRKQLGLIGCPNVPKILDTIVRQISTLEGYDTTLFMADIYRDRLSSSYSSSIDLRFLPELSTQAICEEMGDCRLENIYGISESSMGTAAEIRARFNWEGQSIESEVTAIEKILTRKVLVEANASEVGAWAVPLSDLPRAIKQIKLPIDRVT